MKNTYTGYQFVILDINDFIVDKGIITDATLDDNHTLHVSGWSARNESTLVSYHIERNYEGRIHLYAPTITYPPRRPTTDEVIECL